MCEHCLVSNHPKYIVQSYLKGLQDSNYSPICTLCNSKLSDGGRTVRLLCYDVFHWDCLKQFYASLPHNTASAGYTSRNCSEPLFPPKHQAGLVGDALRAELKSEKWAREGLLGLPLLEVDHNEDNISVVNGDQGASLQ